MCCLEGIHSLRLRKYSIEDKDCIRGAFQLGDVPEDHLPQWRARWGERRDNMLQQGHHMSHFWVGYIRPFLQESRDPHLTALLRLLGSERTSVLIALYSKYGGRRWDQFDHL